MDGQNIKTGKSHKKRPGLLVSERAGEQRLGIIYHSDFKDLSLEDDIKVPVQLIDKERKLTGEKIISRALNWIHVGYLD